MAHGSLSEDITGFDLGISATEIGANVLGGLRFSVGRFPVFAEFRVEAGGGKQFVINGGVLF